MAAHADYSRRDSSDNSRVGGKRRLAYAAQEESINIKTKLLILGSLGGLFDWACIVVGVAAVHFLYGALANQAPVHNLLWSIGTCVIAWNLANTFKSSKQQVDYVDQLIKRGYTHAEATSAWEIAAVGGSNLLLNLQQEERIVENVLRKGQPET